MKKNEQLVNSIINQELNATREQDRIISELYGMYLESGSEQIGKSLIGSISLARSHIGIIIEICDHYANATTSNLKKSFIKRLSELDKVEKTISVPSLSKNTSQKL